MIFGPIFGIKGKIIVCVLLVLLLLLLLVPRDFFSKLLGIFCNVFLSCPFSQNMSVRYSISAVKYFSEQILVALARNSLNMLVIVSGGIQECGLICTLELVCDEQQIHISHCFFFFLRPENLIIFLHFHLLW